MRETNPGLSLLGRINSSEPMLLAPQYNGLSAVIRQMLAVETKPVREHASGIGDLAAIVGNEETEQFLSAYCALWGDNRAERKPFAQVGDMAVIPVHGTLINRFSGAWGFVTGYDYIRTAFDAAVADPTVKGVALDVDSYGGEVQGCFELADHMHKARGTKPVRAIVNASAYSAAYAIASCADKIVLTPSGGAGSIGVVTMHVDYSKALADAGITVSFIFAGDHKVDGNPYQPLPDGVRADIQARIDATYEKFVATVARNRRMDAKKVRDTQARTYVAEDAKKMGLIDSVAAPKVAFAGFANELSGSTTKDTDMLKNDENTEQAQAAPAAPAADTAAAPATEAAAPAAEPVAAAPAAEPVAAAAAAAPATDSKADERARIAGILGADEAKGRGALANHLALNTDLSVEQARAALAASPKESTASGFRASMDADTHPEVGADGGADAAQEPKGASRIVANYRRATGFKLD